MIDWLSGGLLTAGLFFFVSGTAGLVRFPDLYCRLHAVTKADNLGLGLTILALLLRVETPLQVFKLGLIWAMVLVASSSVCFVIASEARRRGHRPWGRPSP